MKIEVDAPQNESRRDRIERNVFTQLAQLRLSDRADAAVPEPPASNRRAWMFAGLGAAVAAIVILVVSTKAPAPAPAPIVEDTTPTRIVTPVGGQSQFTVGDAVIMAASDTSVDVKHAADGGITLVVARGAIECDVAPRHQRPPFHVIAGDVSVEVVGTRFTVTRTPSPRVDVVRGKVRVRAPGGTWLLSAGDSWTPPVTAQAIEPAIGPAIDPAIDPTIDPAIDPARTAPPPQPAPTVLSPHARYQLAEKLEATDAPRAAKMYRSIASSNDAWAAPALFGLAELDAKSNATNALADCEEYLRRFATSAQAEDVEWLRIEILRSAGQRDKARVAATEYLRQWPQGSYAGIARRLASPP
ncbi:MAG: FecR domain-containing protein [Kofleriaceae bacterium]